MKMYKKLGFGLYIVELKGDKTPVGICGLLKREFLENVDIGFAFSSEFHRKGFGYEAALAILHYAENKLKLRTVLAITSDKNKNSSRMLEKLGMTFIRIVLLPHDKEELKLY